MIFTFAGCIVNEPLIEDFPSDKVSFKYEVVGDYGIDYLVGSPIQFTNVSEAVGNVSWDFGDGSPVSVEANPKHTYQTAGTYDVKLTVEGEGTTTKRILISDIFPTITIGDIPNGICEVKTTAVELNVELPNPQNLEVEYTWIFPLGTVNEAGEMVQFSSQVRRCCAQDGRNFGDAPDSRPASGEVGWRASATISRPRPAADKRFDERM